MDHANVGRAVRIVRIKRRMRQRDVAAIAGLSQQTISKVERGWLGNVTFDTVDRVCASLGIRLSMRVGWEGAELDRLLGSRHSAMHEAAAQLFEVLTGWETRPEVSFAIHAERGVIDILAWHAPTRSLLVIELKTELANVQETVGTLDRKHRLAAQIAAERGWRPLTVSKWLLIADSRTNRRRVADHRTMLRAAFPVDGRVMSAWLRSPRGEIAALSFLSSTPDRGANRSFAPVRRVNRRRPADAGRT